VQERLWRKWGGKEAFEQQKSRHRLKERGEEVGIAHFAPRRTARYVMRGPLPPLPLTPDRLRLVVVLAGMFACVQRLLRGPRG
jgi:hypothetical protein